MRDPPRLTKPKFDLHVPSTSDNGGVLAAKPNPDDCPNPIVFPDLSVAGERVGRVVIELYKNIVPKTAENFRALCTGEKGPNLHYKGLNFHRIIHRCMIQGGDVSKGGSTGGHSIYGPCFDDENFDLKHEKPGLVSMANSGPNTNGSQFFITTVNCPQLDGKNVVFGAVRKGMGIVYDTEVLQANSAGQPAKEVKIVNCGEIHPGEDWGICESDGTEDNYPYHPEDLDIDWYLVENFSKILDIAFAIRSSGNHFFKGGDFPEARRKYKKATKYISLLREAMGSTTDEQEKKIRDVEVPCCLNLAAAQIKMRDFVNAKRECDKVLEIDEHNPKALFRRGQAEYGLTDYEGALKDFTLLNKLEPKDRAVLAELKKAKKGHLEHTKKERERYGKMFK